MKKNTVKNVLIAAVLATGTFASSMGSAQAGGNFGVYFGSGNSGIYVGNGGYNSYNYGGYYSPGYSQPVQQVHRSRNKRCHPRRAVRIAYNRFGLNQPYVKRINQRKIVVRGYSYGYPAKIVFKRTRHGCKVIKTRGLY